MGSEMCIRDRRSLLRIISVGADLQAGGLRAPLHQLDVVLVLLGLLRGLVVVEQAGDDFRRSGLDLAGVNRASRAVDGEEVAFLEGVTSDGRRLFIVVDRDGGGTTDADLTHLAGDERSVRGHPTASGEDTFGGDHATEIFRRGFDADEENFLTLLGSDDGAVGVEVDLTGGGTRAGRETGCLLYTSPSPRDS